MSTPRAIWCAVVTELSPVVNDNDRPSADSVAGPSTPVREEFRGVVLHRKRCVEPAASRRSARAPARPSNHTESTTLVVGGSASAAWRMRRITSPTFTINTSERLRTAGVSLLDRLHQSGSFARGQDYVIALGTRAWKKTCSSSSIYRRATRNWTPVSSGNGKDWRLGRLTLSGPNGGPTGNGARPAA